MSKYSNDWKLYQAKSMLVPIITTALWATIFSALCHLFCPSQFILLIVHNFNHLLRRREQALWACKPASTVALRTISSQFVQNCLILPLIPISSLFCWTVQISTQEGSIKADGSTQLISHSNFLHYKLQLSVPYARRACLWALAQITQ